LPSTPSARPGAGFEIEIVDQRKGVLIFRSQGAQAEACFADEPGGHRWQRVPPNDKHRRVQTSTVTVAVLAEPAEANIRIDERDLLWTNCLGTGSGGQKRNKTASTVQLTHVPTGVQVRCETSRSLHHNRITALAILRARLWAGEQQRLDEERFRERKRQVGSGMRGDKRRTIRVQDGIVVDHILGKRWSLKQYQRGEW
jgi:peptide chain release factor 1